MSETLRSRAIVARAVPSRLKLRCALETLIRGPAGNLPTEPTLLKENVTCYDLPSCFSSSL
jgi:hypothetical protein